MITWNDNIRIAEGIDYSVKTVKRRLRWRLTSAALTWCVALAVNENNLLDIYNMGELNFKYYAKSNTEIHVVGIAPSRDAACELASEIIGEIYSETGGFNVRDYFK